MALISVVIFDQSGFTGFAAKKNASNKAFGTGGLVITGASVILIVSVGVYSRVRKGKKNAESKFNFEYLYDYYNNRDSM